MSFQFPSRQLHHMTLLQKNWRIVQTSVRCLTLIWQNTEYINLYVKSAKFASIPWLNLSIILMNSLSTSVWSAWSKKSLVLQCPSYIERIDLKDFDVSVEKILWNEHILPSRHLLIMWIHAKWNRKWKKNTNHCIFNQCNQTCSKGVQSI